MNLAFLPSRRPAASLPRTLVLLVALALASLLIACGEDSSPPATPAPTPAPTPPPTPPPPPPEPDTATYTFGLPDVRISPRIPGSLPDGVGFAPVLALVAHGRDEAPFALGGIASDGLKTLAETGASDVFLAEAEAAGMEVIFASEGEMLAVFLSPDPSVELHLERPCLSYAQMIAPSPDWFIGFSNACATDENDAWADELSGELLAYDAGTAEGDDFQLKAEGADTDPREPIAHLDAPPFFNAPAVVQVLTATRKEE